MGADHTVTIAEAILDLVKAHQPETFSKRDVFNGLARGLVPKAADLDEPLQLLVDRGWLRRVEQPAPGKSGGRPPSPRFEPWPGLLEHRAPQRSFERAA
jgi:replicative DNA helicase